MKYVIIFTCLLAMGCGNSDRQEKDITDSEEQNISPNQTITPEELQKKDSTGRDIMGSDTTVNDR